MLFRISFILLVLPITLTGQNTFNKRMSFDFPASVLTNIIPLNDIYIGSGIVADSIFPHRSSTVFLKFDENGNLFQSSILRSNQKHLEVWKNTFTKLPNDYYLISGMSIDTSNIRRAFLLKYDSFGDTLFFKEYNNPSFPDVSYILPVALTIQENGDVAIACWIENPPLPNTDVSVIITDSLGNLKNHYVYGNGFWEIPQSIIQSPNGNLIIGASKSSLNFSTENYIYQSYIFEIDSTGEVQWTYLSPLLGTLRDAANEMILLEDGSLVVASGAGTEYERPSVNDVWFEKLIYKLNPNQEVEWEREFQNPIPSGSLKLSNLIALSDNSSFVAAGTAFENDPLQDSWTVKGWLGKISPEGDSIWTREYYYLTTQWNYNIIYDLKETPDGGFIMCGEARDASGMDFPQQAWLLKVDEHGCLVPGCHTPVSEIPSQNIQLSIYPNPTSDYLNFLIRQQKRPKNAIVRIINAAGQVVQQIQAIENEVTYMLPVWNWETGVYFLQYIENGLVKQVKEVVVVQ